MNRRILLVLLLAGALLWWYSTRQGPAPTPVPEPVKPEPKPKKPDRPKPKPWGPRPCPGPGPCPLEGQEAGGQPVEGGPSSPDGAVSVVCDLPESQRKKNIASKGLGCCVFRSIDYAARWQQVPELYDLPEQLVRASIPGGGYPRKVDEVMKQFAPDAGYLNDTSGDPAILEAILATGRMPCVTYNGHDVHYGMGQSIAHMVCLPYFDRASGWACVSDNNFPEEGRFVWMSADEFIKRWKGGGGGGWVCALLAAPPPLPPHN
ncbi:MAG TPA: hypothetical protein VH682_14090 [Gemmataceae bacterium]